MQNMKHSSHADPQNGTLFSLLRGGIPPYRSEEGRRRRERSSACGTLPALLFLLLLLVLPAGISGALDVTTLYHMGNLGFERDAEKPTGEFEGTDYTYGLSVFGNHRIDDSLTLEAGLMYDPILRKTVQTRFEYSHNFFRIGVGPFLGVFNTPGTVLKSGISTSVHLEYPGKIFTSLRSDSTISSRFTDKGDYLQEFNKITVGYYVPHAICSLNLTTKRFVTQKTGDLEVDTSFDEYSFDVDIFQKNVPLRLLLSFAFQHTDRIYSTDTATARNALNSLVLGTRFEVSASRRLTLIADVDHNIYSFGSEKDASGSESPISMPEKGLGLYLFQARIGGTWSF
jgi:hypothetical protein